MKRKLSLGFLAASFLCFGSLFGCGGGTPVDNNNPPPPTSTPTFSVGGSLSGLSGGTVVLQLNGGEELSVQAAGSFVFTTKVRTGAGYSVVVKLQPTLPPQTCVVDKGVGTMASANIADVKVTCAAMTYSIGGMATGLVGATGNLVLQNNLTDDLTVQDGMFSFPTPLGTGKTYSVTIKSKPSNRNCTLKNSAGTVASQDISNVEVNCQ